MDILEGKVAVVTGAGSGIGSGMIQAFAEAGMHVVAADIELDRASAVVHAVAGDIRACAVQVDVTDYASVTSLAQTVFEEFPEVHVLCNNAGVMLSGPFLGMKPLDWAWTLEVNVLGVVHGCYAFLPRLLAQSCESHIVNTSSMAAFGSGVNHSAYTASKHACSVVTEALRGELTDTPVSVSGLYPGAVITDILDSQRNRQQRFGEQTQFSLSGHRADEDTMFSQLLEPIDVGRIVVQAIRDNDPWIFTHPTWLTAKRWQEIEAAAAAALARRT